MYFSTRNAARQPAVALRAGDLPVLQSLNCSVAALLWLALRRLAKLASAYMPLAARNFPSIGRRKHVRLPESELFLWRGFHHARNHS